jgi:hypothetical protein
MDGKLVLDLKAKAESELRSDVLSLKSEDPCASGRPACERSERSKTAR